MSLHKFAEQVAAQGRGDDSLLVHMTPDEVRNLQKFAEANGTTLTINPQTGLPEAGFLSDLFKAVAPIALGAFLGPGAFGIAGMGLSAGTAGLVTGGITSLATGSLSRGLMAGLGAYGGAGLAQGFADAGVGAGMSEALAGSSSGNLGQAFGDVAAAEGSSGSAFNKFLTSNANPATMSGTELASAGAKAAMDNPMAFAKQNFGNIAAAAAPIMAGAMVPTTTQLGTPKSDNYIRQFDFNINPETGKPDPLYGVRSMAPVKASEFGNKTFQGQRDLFRQQNPNPYELGVGSLNQPPQQQPTPMATGGIVALADGGVPGYADGALVSDSQIFDYFKGLDQGQINSGALDAKIAADMQTYNVSAADIARATGTQANQGDFETRFVNAVATPGITADQFNAYTADVGLTGQNLANALANSGLSQSAQYALTHNLNDINTNYGGIKGTNFYTDLGYTSGIAPGDVGGLKGLYDNIGYAARSLQGQIGAGSMTGQQAREAALTEMNRIGISAGDVKAATGKTIAELFPDTKTKITDIKTTGTGGTGGTSVIPGGNYGNVTNPGDITTNPDGSVTVHPNIPGRPPGGFTGIQQIKDAYTAGGGSLGYTARAPRTIDEFNQMFNKQTGDSLAAYDYLMGKGANKNAYPVKSGVPKISEDYDKFVLGRKTVGLKPKTTEGSTVKGTPSNPQTYFDEAAYLAANPDVAAEMKAGNSNFTSAYEHWLRYGRTEGRKFMGDYEGFLVAETLANAARESGGDGPSGPSGNTGNTISGFNPAPPNDSIPDTTMGPASTASPPGTGESVSGDYNNGGLLPRGYAVGGGLGSLGSYSDGGRLLKGPGDGVSDSIPATIGSKQQPARLADGEFVIPARIVSELGNGSTDAGAKKLYAMMDRVQKARGKTTGKNKVAANSRSDKYLPA